MNFGHDKALYLLPFDHRQSYVTGMYDFKLPLSAAQHAQVSDSKQLIYEGFRQALADGMPSELVSIRVDEGFGSDILRDAHRHGMATAVSTEKSGTDEFNCEYGADSLRHIEAFDLTFAKVLARYNSEADAPLNRRQVDRLKQLSDYYRRTQRRFVSELLVAATEQQLALAGGDKAAHEQRTLPLLMNRVIRSLQNAGVEPDIWKIEGRIAAKIANALSTPLDATGALVSAASCLAVAPTKPWCATGLRQRQALTATSDLRSGARVSGMQWPAFPRER